MQAGLSQEQIEQVHDHQTSKLFSARERLALKYADCVTLSGEDVDEGLFDGIKAEFGSPATIVELTAIVAFENYRSKLNHALLVEANGVCLVQSAHGPGMAGA